MYKQCRAHFCFCNLITILERKTKPNQTKQMETKQKQTNFFFFSIFFFYYPSLKEEAID